MLIKQVVIRGFKSYGKQVVTANFSPKLNCIVGANGSGKSNFFDAICFVICCFDLTSEEKQALLHDGAGNQVLSAFVEIVFDISDNRFPVDKEEVRVRRTISIKEDEYLLDGKHITKTEVVNLMESLGFNCSNPYNVVQQGKIASLASMMDSERLDLLKKIGGARVYEERRHEILKIMKGTDKKHKSIEVARYVDDRLRELEEEVDLLTKYQHLGKQRKYLEYAIYDKELHDATQKLVELETRLEMNFSTNLVRWKEESEAVKESTDTEMLQGEADLKRQDLMDANELDDRLSLQLKRASENIDQRNKKLEDNLNAVLEGKHQAILQDEAKELEQLLSKKNIYLAKQEEYSKKIRELGPPYAFETYKRKGKKELYKLLNDCDEQLQHFNHVNKEALDHYLNLTNMRDELQRRQAEMDEFPERISELISILDVGKDETIERAFEGMAKHFPEVFSELVEGGHGFLVMMEKKDDADSDRDDDEPRPADAEARVEKYTGFKVKVSFTRQGETRLMEHLSGGQKKVVALALVFSMLRCDPAPFCLFDDIDAGLYPHYRTAAANMVRRLADTAGTQFITTTFRPELLKVADKICHVTNKNGVSCVNVVSKGDTFDFIEYVNESLWAVLS